MSPFRKSLTRRQLRNPRRSRNSFYLLIALCLLCLAPILVAQLSEETRAHASELFQKYQSESTDTKERDEFATDLIGMGREVTRRFLGFLDDSWNHQYGDYQKAYVLAADALAKTKKSLATRAELEKHRQVLQDLWALDDALTKDHLESEGLPALLALQNLLLVTPEEVLNSSPPLDAQRNSLTTTLRHRQACIAELIDTTSDPVRESDLVAWEKATATAKAAIDKKSLQILERNSRAKGDITDPERLGIQELNLIRAVTGMPALEIDFDLCIASRGHSKDMKDHGFFAHESPVKGKETPQKRAALEGASFSGENLFVGSPDPHEANRGWFLSPGHHLNMFKNHRTVGMGNHGNHWTQMFGR